MQYKPLESAVKYFIGLYGSAKGIVQKLDSLIPSSGLEFAVAGIPNSALSTRTEATDKMQGYLLAAYGVNGYVRTGRKELWHEAMGNKSL